MRRNGPWIAVAVMGLAVLVTGCNDSAKPPKTPSKAGHVHPTEGPHGGALVEWGAEEYHLELLLDHSKKEVTVYVLDGDAKKVVPIKAETLTMTVTNVKPPVTVTLKANPDTGDAAGSSSRFIGTHEVLAKEVEGEINGKVGETPFSGEFKDKNHKGHDHNK